MVTAGAKIYGTVINSIIGSNVEIKKGAVVKDSVIFSDTIIEEDAQINYSIIDEKVVIGKNAKVGKPKADNVSIAVIGRCVMVDDGAEVDAGANVEENVHKKEGIGE